MNPPAAPISGRARATAVFIGLLAALAGLMFGLDIGVISGATQFIQRGFAINDHAIELIVSSMMAGAAIGALIAGFLSAYAVSPRALIGARIVLGFAIGIACSTVTNWIANMIVGASFLTLLDQFGRANTFWLYAGLNVVFLLITIALVPETRGVILEFIERNLMAGKRLCDIGR